MKKEGKSCCGKVKYFAVRFSVVYMRGEIGDGWFRLSVSAKGAITPRT
jgi:hypothetical protein